MRKFSTTAAVSLCKSPAESQRDKTYVELHQKNANNKIAVADIQAGSIAC